MGFSVMSSPGTSSMMAEINLVNHSGEVDAETGLLLPQELVDPEMLKNQQGVLKGQGPKGEAKPYTFVFQEKSSLPEKLVDYLEDLNRPKEEKLLDPKNGKSDLQFKESYIKEKEFKVFEPQKQTLDGQEKKEHIKPFEKTGDTTHQKSLQTMDQNINKSSAPLNHSAQKHESLSIKQHQVQAKILEQKVQKEIPTKEALKRPASNETKKNESKRSDLKQALPSIKNTHTENEKTPELRIKEKHKEREEGFGESRKRKDDEQPEGDEDNLKIRAIDEAFNAEFASYATEASILSQLLDMRVSQFDVLILFMEILKLEIRGREQERIGRRLERELQIKHMQNVVENYKKEGKWMLFSSLGSGILGIVSGACPIINHMKGDWIHQKLSSVFSSLAGIEKDKLFKGITNITHSMSEMYKSTGSIQSTFAQGDRAFDQHMSDLYRSDWDESTRSMEEIKDSWKGIENFLYQSLQMYHEAIRQLYSH